MSFDALPTDGYVCSLAFGLLLACP